MDKRRTGRLFQVVGVLMIATLAVSWVALADSVVADGDGLVPITPTTLNLGSMCMDASVTADPPPLVAIQRNQDGSDVFADGSSVSVAVTAINARGVMASVDAPATIAIPDDWSSAEPGTMSPAVTVTVDYTPVFIGPFIGYVELTASGVNANGEALTRTTTLVVTSTGVDCTWSPVPTSVSVWTATGPAGGTTSLTAVITTGESGISGKVVDFTLNDEYVGTAISDVSGVVTVSDVSLDGIEPGTYEDAVAAIFEGDDIHAPTRSTGDLIVEGRVATLSLDGLEHVYDGTPKGVTVTTDPPELDGVQVTYDGDPAEPVDAGTYHVVATLDNAEYAAEPVEGTLVISPAETSVTVECLAGPFVYNGSEHTPCTAVVTGPGGLNEAVEIVYSDNVNAGTATATATWAGTSNYQPSSDTATFDIQPASQKISFPRRVSVIPGSSSFLVSATTTSGLPATFESLTPTACSVDAEGVVSPITSGLCTIQVSQPGDGNYLEARPVSRSFLVIMGRFILPF